jgi:integrase
VPWRLIELLTCSRTDGGDAVSGSVKKYGSTWRIRWDAGARPDGTRVQRSRAGFGTRREAEAALASIQEQLRTGHATHIDKMTVANWMEAWLASKRSIRPTTRRSYEGHIRVHIAPHIGTVALTSLRADHLDRMYEAIRSGEQRPAPSAATIRRIHATLRTALNAAYRRRLISFNPAGQVELDPEPSRERDVWSQEQLNTFLTASETSRLGGAYRLIAMTGLRRGECCALRWSDVQLDDEGASITVHRQLTQSGAEIAFGDVKTRRSARRVALDPDTVATLRRHKARQASERLAFGRDYQDHDLVFCLENGAPLRPETLTRQFLSISAAAGLPRIVLHGLRHTHATHALAAGVDITIVARRLGHAKSSFTADTYARVLPETDRAAAEEIARSLRAARTQASQGRP